MNYRSVLKIKENLNFLLHPKADVFKVVFGRTAVALSVVTFLFSDSLFLQLSNEFEGFACSTALLSEMM